jgi:exodeoxyribonuclease VII small subunit
MAKKTFEMAMKQLEQIVQDLETGDMPLEKAIKKFEEGIKISKYCSEKLDESEKRITLLMRDSDGNASEIPFVTEDEISEDNSDS